MSPPEKPGGQYRAVAYLHANSSFIYASCAMAPAVTQTHLLGFCLTPLTRKIPLLKGSDAKSRVRRTHSHPEKGALMKREGLLVAILWPGSGW